MTQKNKEPLDRNVIITGLTSFFTDVSSEMVYPLLQGFISAVMRGQAVMLGPVLGIIEGIAESTAGLLKVFSGYWSDKKESRKLPTVLGYAVSAFSRLLLFVPFWYTILAARFLDKTGKGIRTAPRDALISESTPMDQQGRAFGFQRGMDFAGALLGTAILFFLVRYVFPDVDKMQDPSSFYPLFAIALLPAFIGVFCLFFIREEAGVRRELDKQRPSFNLRNYPGKLRIFFLAQFIFTLGNSSNQFLLLRSSNLGYALSSVIVMYMIFNLTTSLLSTPFGSLSDRIGRKRLLMGGYSLYAVVYMAFGFISASGSLLLWIFWPLYGIYYAMTEGVEKAFVADTAPGGSKGTALGFYNTIVGIGLLPASVIAGILYSWIPSAPFVFGGATAIVTVIIIGLFIKERE
jgi:MFS family permease